MERSIKADAGVTQLVTADLLNPDAMRQMAAELSRKLDLDYVISQAESLVAAFSDPQWIEAQRKTASKAEALPVIAHACDQITATITAIRQTRGNTRAAHAYYLGRLTATLEGLPFERHWKDRRDFGKRGNEQDAEQIEQAKQLHAAIYERTRKKQMADKRVAKELGVSQKTVQNWRTSGGWYDDRKPK